ncbi:MAG: hypothetical protein ACOX2A_05425 [Tepidanaerobacteraceae bacterium]
MFLKNIGRNPSLVVSNQITIVIKFLVVRYLLALAACTRLLTSSGIALDDL